MTLPLRYRALAGHSAGGLFVAYALLQDPRLFNRYLISSPSLWWNQGEMFAREAAFAEVHEGLTGAVFLSVGELENERMVPSIGRFAEVLKSRDYDGLRFGSHVIADENHISVTPAAFSRGLRFLYEDVPSEDAEDP